MCTKTELRKEMKEKRKNMTGSPETTFLSHLPKGQTYFVYRSFQSEASTQLLIERLQTLGKHVVTPRIEGKEMFAVEEGNLVKHKFGMEESDGDIYQGQIDVAVIPLLAVDEQGHRLGYGGGYYDRFLHGRECLKVGLCFEEQYLNAIPYEEHDVLLDLLCTEKQIVHFRRTK